MTTGYDSGDSDTFLIYIYEEIWQGIFYNFPSSTIVTLTF